MYPTAELCSSLSGRTSTGAFSFRPVHCPKIARFCLLFRPLDIIITMFLCSLQEVTLMGWE